MKLVFPKGTTSRIVTVFIQDSSATTGAGLGSLTNASSIVGGYVREGATGVALAVDEDVTTEGTYQAPSAAGKVRIGTPANMRTGTYELHFHNDLWATGAETVTITLGGATNMAPLNIEVQLSDPVRGLGAPTALPNAAADAPGGLPISDAGGLDLDAKIGALTFTVANKVDANVTHVGGTLQTAGNIYASLGDILDATTCWNSITSGAGTTTTLVDTALTQADTDYWVGQWVKFLDGVAAGQVRLITGFNPATDTITFAPAATQAIASGVTYIFIPAGRVHADAAAWLGTAIATPDTAGYPKVTIKSGTGTGEISLSAGAVASVSEVDDFTLSAQTVIQTLAEAALQTYHLDHFIASADPGAIVANSSLLAKLVSKSATPVFSSYNNTTDSLEALRVSTLDAAGVRSAVGLAAANLDTQLGDIPTNAELTTALANLDAAVSTRATPAQVATELATYDGPTNAEMEARTLVAASYATASALSTAQTDLTQIKNDLPTRPTKNTALANFPFVMRLSSDHVTGATGKTVTATRSIDGAGHSACANAVAEVANGEYKIDLAASDMNGNTITLRFTAADCDDTFFTIVTQP